MKFSRNKIIILVAAIVLLIGLWFINFGNGVSEYYSTSWVCMSIKDSKSKGVFIRKLNIEPTKIKYDSLNIELNECWIEKQTRLTHSWLFFQNYQFTGKYRLCFNLKNKLPNNTLFPYYFVDSKGTSFILNGSGNEVVFNTFLNKNTLEQFNINLKNNSEDSKIESTIIVLK